jgi:environmental stress-induced protein Ves
MTREVLHLSTDDARRVPWKNGRGYTDELALWPEGARFDRLDFDWRISKASVTEDGPFSSFEGFDRILVVTRGEGLVLAHGDAAPRARLRKLDPHRFSGDWPTEAKLVAGAVHDFNVVFRASSVHADVQALKLGTRRARESLPAGHAFLHALDGAIVARVGGEEEPYELDAGESLWVRELARDEELELAGRAPASVALLVRIEDAR